MKLVLQSRAEVVSETRMVRGSDLRHDLSSEHIARVNAQIHKFAAFREGVDNLLDNHNRMQRSYDSAATTPYNLDFKGTYTSANSEILASDYQTIARSRTICKDTPQGKAIVRTHMNNVVGHDPRSIRRPYKLHGCVLSPLVNGLGCPPLPIC